MQKYAQLTDSYTAEENVLLSATTDANKSLEMGTREHSPPQSTLMSAVSSGLTRSGEGSTQG